MAKYSISDTSLTAIADAIRAKTKTTGTMTPEQMAALIASIETGGGLPEGVSALASGTITLASDSIASGVYRIEHGMGAAPNFYMIAIKGRASVSEHAGYLCLAYCADVDIMEGYTGGVRGFIDTITSGGTATSNMNFSSGMDTVMFNDSTFSLYLSNRPLKAGTTYTWVCGVLDGIE